MFFEEKIAQINSRLHQLSSRSKFVIWGIGEHTCNLLLYTDLSLFWDKAVLVDKQPRSACFAQKEIVSPNQIRWHEMDCVLISSFQHQCQIAEELRQKLLFDGQILTLYADNEIDCFYHLYQKDRGITYGGCYECWEDASRLCQKGYADTHIAEAMFTAALHTEPSVNHLLVYYCLKHYQRHGQLNVIDFGGGSATQFWNCQQELSQTVPEFRWFIVEQPDMVQLAAQFFSHPALFYYESLAEVKEILGDAPCLIYINGVLQYLPSCSAVVEQLLDFAADTLILERFLMGEQRQILLQRVHDYIYDAAYPLHVFDNAFLQPFLARYHKAYDRESPRLYLSDQKVAGRTIVLER